MNQKLLETALYVIPTIDPRIRIASFGDLNVRTIVQDEPGGEWDITGPPYPSRRAAMAAVDDILCYYFGEQPTRGQLAARIEAALAIAAEGGSFQHVARMVQALAGHADQPRPRAVIAPEDLEISTTRPGVRRGGLTTGEFDPYVSITHKPTGITVAYDAERSQLMNKAAALGLLASALAGRAGATHAQVAQASAAVEAADVMLELAVVPPQNIAEWYAQAEAEMDAEFAKRRAGLVEVRWAPYREFGTPDPALESFVPPAGPVTIRATGYQREHGTERVVIYWLEATP